MTNHKDMSMVVSPQSKDSRWVALDSNDKIISEGKTPNEVLVSAKKIADNFFLMFVPLEGNTYVF